MPLPEEDFLRLIFSPVRLGSDSKDWLRVSRCFIDSLFDMWVGLLDKNHLRKLIKAVDGINQRSDCRKQLATIRRGSCRRLTNRVAVSIVEVERLKARVVVL